MGLRHPVHGDLGRLHLNIRLDVNIIMYGGKGQAYIASRGRLYVDSMGARGMLHMGAGYF